MLCLLLTVLAHLFPAGERRRARVGERVRAGERPGLTRPNPAGSRSGRRCIRAHLPGGEARRGAAAARGRDRAALRAQGLQAGGAEAGAGEGARGAAAGRQRGAGGRVETPPRAARPHPGPPQASDELLREHYAELRERPFFGRLVDYMGSGPVVAMVSARRAGGRVGGPERRPMH